MRRSGAPTPIPRRRRWRSCANSSPTCASSWLRRDNIVAQAISHYVAIATNIWNSRQGGAIPPAERDRGAAYDFDKIEHQVESVLAVTKGWGAALKGAEAITLPMSYEELAADLPAAVRRLCAFVGVDLGEVRIRAPLEKQAGPWSREMERRYRDERRTRGLGPVGDEGRI